MADPIPMVKNPPAERVWDVLIIGGGPAGLSAALALLRACRSVMLIDAGEQRNLVSPAMHGFLSRDGIAPAEFLALCRRELAGYENFAFARGAVIYCEREGALFCSSTEDGQRVFSRTVLLASGVVDALPQIDGIRQFYGRGVHHCPYCDGWEHRGQPMVVCGDDGPAADMAWELKAWSRDISFIVRQKSALLPKHLARIEKSGARLIEGVPVKLEGEGGVLKKVILADGVSLPVRAFFFAAEEVPRCDLARILGCGFEGKHLKVSESFATTLKGCFAAGNMCKGRNMVVIAASQGTIAAISINEYLLEQAS